MGGKTELQQEIPHFLIVISFVQAHVLRMFLSRFRTVYPDVFDRFAHQFHIVTIGPFYCQTHRHSVALGQKATFGALLAPVGGVSARIFPSQRGLRHRPVHPQPFPVDPFQLIKALHSDLPESEKNPRPLPILGNGHGRWSREPNRSHPGPSTGNWCATRRKWHRRTLYLAAPGATSTQRVGVPVLGKKGLEHLPQFIGNAKTGSRFVVGRSGPSPFFGHLFTSCVQLYPFFG